MIKPGNEGRLFILRCSKIVYMPCNQKLTGKKMSEKKSKYTFAFFYALELAPSKEQNHLPSIESYKLGSMSSSYQICRANSQISPSLDQDNLPIKQSNKNITNEPLVIVHVVTLPPPLSIKRLECSNAPIIRL